MEHHNSERETIDNNNENAQLYNTINMFQNEYLYLYIENSQMVKTQKEILDVKEMEIISKFTNLK